MTDDMHAKPEAADMAPGGTIAHMAQIARRHGLATTSARTWPIVETFGPTIQGEGPEAGRPCWFVRLGACDFRCSWCDSMYAVEPARVREADRLDASGVMHRLDELGAWDREHPYIVLSGGNPALHHLSDLVDALHEQGAMIAVETQGTVYRDWLDDVDRLVVSPKPPSSGMWTARHADQFGAFMGRARQPLFRAGEHPRMALKVVIADDTDYACARAWHLRYPGIPFYLSVCTPQVEPIPGERHSHDDYVRSLVARGYQALCEKVANDSAMNDVVVLPQLHVIAWGTRAGV
jgi:7-carboxy-7-deazaguanine synthase